MSLQVDKLTFARGDNVLFTELDFGVLPGCAVRLSGANGSGKTSLLRLLAGLSTPLAGLVRWHGEEIGRLRGDYTRELAYLGHANALNDSLSATENLCFAEQWAGRRCNAADARYALAGFGLTWAADLPVRHLSQGQRKRAALARLRLSADSKLWLLDEPFSALDETACEVLSGLLDSHLTRGGMLVYTTHQPVSLKAKKQSELALGAAC